MLAAESSTHFCWSFKLGTFIMVNVLEALDIERGLSFQIFLSIFYWTKSHAMHYASLCTKTTKFERQGQIRRASTREHSDCSINN